MNNVAHDGDDGHSQRMALALLAALGLHAALFLLPGDWRSLHFPKPRRFEVVMLPSPAAPTLPAGTPEPAASGSVPGPSAAATLPEPFLPPVPEPAQVEPSPPAPEPVPAVASEPAPAVPPEPVQVEPSPPAPESVPAVASEPAPAVPPEPARVEPSPPVPESVPAVASEPAPAVPPEPARVEPVLAVPPKPALEPAVPKLAHPPRKPVAAVPLEPATEAKPASKKPPTVAKPAPTPRNDVRPVSPPKPAKPHEKPARAPQSAEPPARPHRPIAHPTPKPATPAAAPESARPAKPAQRSGSISSTAPRHLDSAALLGQVASIEAETARRENAGVRIKSVSLTDTHSLAGFYVADWVRKVTRVGEMNFPDVARRLPSSSGPVLEVVIRADGSLQKVAIKRSSGNAELDREAKRIVELAAPYPVFSSELRQQYDLLRIESPWRFEPSGRIRTR